MEFGDGVSFAVVPTVFKREDYKRTKHDSVFSKWQVLIGSNDWEDFNNGKDGVGRYRVQNLPRKSFPGLYELGVAVISQDQGRKLEPDDVLAAYLGQAESVRTRLQRYGRSGAHLRNVYNLVDCETVESSPVKKAVTGGLFEDIFSKGGSILYRWAPMGSKRVAEATEGMLLSTFDYAWNKGSNGERRQLDLLKKLGDREFMSKRKSGISRVFFPFLRNQVGIRIKGEKHVLKEERKLSSDVDEEEKSSNFLTSLLKLTRSRPQPVSDRFDEVDGSSTDPVCRVVLENGSFCSRSPVKGRKRCVEHKGQRVCRVSPVKQSPPPNPEMFTRQDHHNHNDSDVTCGVILPDMEPCNKRPVPGRKRCEDHKGMRINAFLFLLNQTDREKTVKDERSDPESHKELSDEEGSPSFCEATTKNGLPCTRSSSKGSKRCWQHKEKISPVCFQPKAAKIVACGVKQCNGLICERSPVKGRKRCEEHKGMRIT
ncbi:PREDICTED: protein EFFECTOR OF TRANSCRIPTION 2-like [Camelina sativa]|uniref:Protein EFFECTOR OF TRANSCRIPTION 2-like n=1 Tax=Camelina sativa TaxID=90675 RepID=A0ABM0UMI9_CAMSA|nr:PREDICTED: protein EFFECTOR OF TRANSCRIPTION 2-like [Camelina sativa]